MRFILLYAWLLGFCVSANALDIGVVGVFPNKAVLVIDGASPKTYSAGDQITPQAKLLSTDGSSATFLIDGKRETIILGQHVVKATPSGMPSVTLQADSRGHFMVAGRVNGIMVNMMLDTGATMIGLSAAEAVRLGVPYKEGKSGMVRTANGSVPVYLVKLDSVKIGDIELHHVDAAVNETGSLPFALLGMSFLNRTDMRREGDRMTLTKRF